MAPHVSVVITTYNQARYIGAAVASALEQSYRDFEVIVVDDGSTDGTAAELNRYRSALRYVRQENRGIAASRNAGIRHATGRLLAFLDGDDVWHRDKLQRQVAAALAYPGSGLIASDGVEFADDEIVRESLLDPGIVGSFNGQDIVTLRCQREFITRNLIATTSQVMVPRTVIDRIGPSDERFPVASDWDLYLRISAAFDVTFLRSKLVKYRYLPGSASGPRSFRSFRWGLDELLVLREHKRRATPEIRRFVGEELARRTRRLAEEAYYHGAETSHGWARGYLFRVVARNPTSLAALVYLVGACTPRLLARKCGRLVRTMVGLRKAS